jgi:hypothetical protein
MYFNSHPNIRDRTRMKVTCTRKRERSLLKTGPPSRNVWPPICEPFVAGVEENGEEVSFIVVCLKGYNNCHMTPFTKGTVTFNSLNFGNFHYLWMMRPYLSQLLCFSKPLHFFWPFRNLRSRKIFVGAWNCEEWSFHLLYSVKKILPKNSLIVDNQTTHYTKTKQRSRKSENFEDCQSATDWGLQTDCFIDVMVNQKQTFEFPCLTRLLCRFFGNTSVSVL